MSSAIAIGEITLRYAGRLVIDRLSLTVQPGEVLTLLGPSGSGKTSLLRVILGFATPETGLVRLSGEVASREGRLLMLPKTGGSGLYSRTSHSGLT